MGKPDNIDDFTRFDADDIIIYISRELLDRQEPSTRRLPFYIDGYGRFWLRLDEPQSTTHR